MVSKTIGYLKLCASFSRHLWIKTCVTVWECRNWGKIYFDPYDLALCLWKHSINQMDTYVAIRNVPYSGFSSAILWISLRTDICKYYISNLVTTQSCTVGEKDCVVLPLWRLISGVHIMNVKSPRKLFFLTYCKFFKAHLSENIPKISAHISKYVILQ